MILNIFVKFRDWSTSLFQTTISVARIMIMSSIPRKNLYPRTTKRKCIILGNGPSGREAIEFIKSSQPDVDLICVNHFPTTPEYESLKPRYYVTGVPELFMEDINEISVERKEKLFSAIRTKTTWPITLYLPFLAKKHKGWRAILGNNANVEIKYFNNTPIEGYRWFSHASYRLNLGSPRPHNVLVPSTISAINLGFKEIYLTGADHSWLPEISVNEDNIVLINQKHFYDENSSKPTPMDKLGKGERKLHEVLQKFMYTFHGYFLIKDYAESRGSVILNATPNSFIDAFDRVDIKSLKN